MWLLNLMVASILLIPGHIEGKSLAPVLKGEKGLNNNDVFLQWNGCGDRNLGTPAINRMVAMPWRSVVTSDRWKLNLSSTDQSELYDLSADPYEMTNLYNDPTQRERIHDMAARIRAWMAQTGDSTALPTI